MHGQLSWQGGQLAALRSGARTPTQIVLYDDTTLQRKGVVVGPLSGWGDLPLPEADRLDVAAAAGSALPARRYVAAPPTCVCPLSGVSGHVGKIPAPAVLVSYGLA